MVVRLGAVGSVTTTLLGLVRADSRWAAASGKPRRDRTWSIGPKVRSTPSNLRIARALDEYFTEFEAIDADGDSQFEALFADFPDDEDAFAEEANLELFKELLVGFPRIVGDLIVRAKDLDPPAEVEDAHNDLIDAGEALRDAFSEGVEFIGDAETMAEFETLSLEVDPTITVAETAFDAACLTVVDIAIANDIDVSVTCEDE